MRAAGPARVIDHVREALAPSGEAPTDGDLLALFAAAGDEASFAALVARHGPMVLAVCRRVLRHEQDAEDAFQAAFLVLAKKARSLRADALAAWLYEVANRTALEARSIRARLQARERQVERLPHKETMPPEPQDWRPVLDRELGRLPLKYRSAIVLCDLQGRTRAEAARQLGVPEGTLSSRLAKGKQLLARRLARLAPGCAGAALLAEGTAFASVPEALCGATVKAALLVAAGLEVAAATPAAALMKGVINGMFLMKLKVASVVAALAALGAGGFVYQTGSPAPVRAQAAVKPGEDAAALRKENELLKLNLEVVLKEVCALRAEVAALKARGTVRWFTPDGKALSPGDIDGDGRLDGIVTKKEGRSKALESLEAAMKAVRERPDDPKAVSDLEKAVKRLQDGLGEKGKQPGPASGPAKQ